MLKQEVEIINKLGLHARASSKFTQTAGAFAAEVRVCRNGRCVNGKRRRRTGGHAGAGSFNQQLF